MSTKEILTDQIIASIRQWAAEIHSADPDLIDVLRWLIEQRGHVAVNRAMRQLKTERRILRQEPRELN